MNPSRLYFVPANAQIEAPEQIIIIICIIVVFFSVSFHQHHRQGGISGTWPLTGHHLRPGSVRHGQGGQLSKSPGFF